MVFMLPNPSPALYNYQVCNFVFWLDQLLFPEYQKANEQVDIAA